MDNDILQISESKSNCMNLDSKMIKPVSIDQTFPIENIGSRVR